MVIHPQFDPVAVSLGFLSINWYALAYLAGFICLIYLGGYRIKRKMSPLTAEEFDAFGLYVILGVVLGGRLGYVLFYNFSFYLSHPLEIFAVWKGGMSFHGGFLGVLVATIMYSRSRKIAFAEFADFITPLFPTGLAFGRIGNFINGELWGRVIHSDSILSMGFPHARAEDIEYLKNLPSPDPFLTEMFEKYGMLPRHPSNIYEFLLEGVLLFIILWVFSSKRYRYVGQTWALFLTGYGLFRFLVEFTRQPDAGLGLLSLGLSMGQWLSLPMIIVGVGWFVYATKKKKIPSFASEDPETRSNRVDAAKVLRSKN